MTHSFRSTLSHQFSPAGIVCKWEARHSGRPSDEYTVRSSPLQSGGQTVELGSPTRREALSLYEGQSLGLLPIDQSPIGSPYPTLTPDLTPSKTDPTTRPYSSPPHPRPTLTPSLPYPQPAITPATSTTDPSMEYLSPNADTLTTEMQQHRHQG